MNRNNIYTVNPLYNGSTTQATGDDSVQSGGTTIIYQQGGGTGLTDAQKQKLDGIQEGAEVNQNAYSKVRLNGSDTLIIEAKNKTDILNMSGVYPIAIAINGNGGLDFTVSSDQSNTNSVVTQSQLKAAIDQLEKDKYWKVDADGKLYTELDVYSHKEISAYGAGTGGGSTGGAGALYECADVLRDGDKVKGAEVGSVLSYNGTHWYAIPQSAIVPDLSGYATKSYVSQEINDLIGGAPGTLDTLKEIAEALGNNPNFATTVTEMINNIGLRVDQVEDRVVSLEDMFEWDKSASASDPSLWRIKAKKDLYGVGEISAYGLGETQPSVTTLAGLDDVTITSPANGQTLIYDSATSQWKNGTIIGGGNISLNGTVYKPVNGTITLPNLYEKISGGTSSQFLKADGSVDGNLYALAYNNNQNKVLESNVSNSLHVIDRRNTVMLPTTFEDNTISTFFNLQSTPTNNWWSGIAVKGWSGEYGVWMLAGPAAGDNAGNRLYYKDGNHSNWATDWKGLAFLDDISNLGDVYFNGQNIYNDYGYWVIGLLRIGTADIGDKYISGEMIYRRSNGIYGNGSVRFNLIKKYSSTQMFAGVFYTGYGIDPDQDAPRLCTFTYQGVKWGGLCWRSAASLNSIKTIIYDNSSTDAPFYVLYYQSNISDVTNPEINNSISVLGSDIDIQPVSTNGRFYTSADRIEINNITNGWSYTRYRTNGRYYDIGLSGTTAGMNGTGNFEIRSSGDNNDGIFVRYGSSAYGKLGVVSKNTNDCTISYYNSVSGSTYPTWTVGIGIRNKYSFDWQYYNQGYKMTLDSEGKLFVNVKGQGNPSCSLAIGDCDTGLNWHQDGMIVFKSNNKDVGHWNYSEGRLYNTYFREPTGNVYAATSMMVNGNGSNLYPGIGFHQPGVTAGVVYFTSAGEFKFRNINDNGYTNVYGGNLIADAGFLYSRYNGIEIKIGAENGSYVHFITKPARSLYFANSLFISGGVLPYTTTTHDLGDAGHVWRNIYANRLIGEADKSVFLVPNYIGGQQANPQTYFGPETGLRVAMTGSIKHWNDTLWINGYSGSDVRDMCALHTVRDGTPQMYISTQKSDATSYGTMYLFYTSYNANKSDRPWICSTLNARDQILAGSYIQALGGVNCAGVINSGGCSGFNVYATFHGNGDHGGIEIAASDNVLGIGVHKNDAWYMWWTNSGSTGSSFNKSYIFSYNGSSWNFTGSVVASGEVTAYSDVRLKSNIQPLKYRGRLTPKTYIKDNKQSIGFIAQEVQILYPETVLMSDDKEHYLSLNYNALTAVLAAQLNDVDDEVTLLKKRVEFLEKEVKRLSE